MNVSSSSLTTVKHVVNIQAWRKLFPQGLGGGGGTPDFKWREWSNGGKNQNHKNP